MVNLLHLVTTIVFGSTIIVGIFSLSSSSTQSSQSLLTTLGPSIIDSVPNGAPTILGYGNATSTSVSLQFAPPPSDTVHGELLGYKIILHPKDKPSLDRTIILPDPSLRVSFPKEHQ